MLIAILTLTGCATASPLVKATSLSTLTPVSIKLPASATPPKPLTGSRPNFTLVHQASIFTVYAVEGDQQAVQDITQALQEQAPRINDALSYDYRGPVRVEIFPDQDSLDHYGMNPEMQGYYAYSGDQRIQMVSPRNPTVQPEIDYSQRVLIAAHEYVHLVNNAINPNIPSWLGEGAAIYMGPHDLYAYVCQNMFPFKQLPSFGKLEQSYDSVPAADLFSYMVVDFIAHEFGQEKLNCLIRNPDNFETILAARSEFEQRWKDYLHLHCTKGK